jgi:hypothetical protein
MRKQKANYRRDEEHGEEPIVFKKSLGALFKNKNTKPRSPELTGQIKLQSHTIEAIVKDSKRTEGGEVICNIAAWRNIDQRGKQYITIELSPLFRPQAREGDIMDFPFGDD